MKKIFFLILMIFFLPFFSAFNISGDVYSVGSDHLGSSGDILESTDSTGRDTLDYQQAGDRNASSDIYSLNLGWFKQPSVATDEEPSEEEVSVSDTAGGGGGSASLQFDVKILDIESPINLGESFDFMYFIKGVGNIEHDVTIDFWVEKDGEIISSGSDVIFIGTNEEKTESASLFLPKNIKSGNYKFIIKASYGNIQAEAHRTIELTIRDGEAIIKSLFDIRFLLDETILISSDDLFAVAIFENFGNKTTTVNLTFIILDEKGNKIHYEEENITVETEELLRKNFKGLNLDTGKYTIILETLYGDNVKDEFKQDFEIIRKKEINLCFLGFVGLIFIIVILLIWYLIKSRKKRKEKDLEKRVKVYKKPMKKRIKKKTNRSIHEKIKKEIGNI